MKLKLRNNIDKLWKQSFYLFGTCFAGGRVAGSLICLHDLHHYSDLLMIRTFTALEIYRYQEKKKLTLDRDNQKFD